MAVKPPVPLSHQAERKALLESRRVGGLVAAWEEQVGLPVDKKTSAVQPSKSLPDAALRRPSSGAPARSRRPRSAGFHARPNTILLERTESMLPPNGAKAAESRVQDRLAVLRSSGAELTALERRVVSYRTRRRTAGGVYYVTQNMDPVILRRKRPKTVYAVSRLKNDRYRAERDQVLARRDAERARQMDEHIASRDRHELKRQAMKEARLQARRLKQEKAALVVCVLASRMEAVRSQIEAGRLSHLLERGRDSAIRKLQNAWREIRRRKSEALLGNAARVIQKGARMFLWRLAFKRKRVAASKIIEYTRLCSGAGGFVQMLHKYRSRVVLIQRIWKQRRLTRTAIVVALNHHWDRVKQAVAVERTTLQEAAVMLKRSGKLSPELREQIAALVPSLFDDGNCDSNTAASSSAPESYPTKSLKDRRKDARNEALALKHAMLGKIELRMKMLPQFNPAKGKEVSRRQRNAALEDLIRRRHTAFRMALRVFNSEWSEYESAMVGVEQQLATRRALGAKLDTIDRPARPVKPRLTLIPPQAEMWATILECELRARKGRRS